MPPRAPVFAALLALILLTIAAQHLRADPPSHDAAFSDDGLVKANVADLKDTQLVAHPDAPIPANTNVVWCGTMQLAWNEAINLVGEKLQFVTQPLIVDLLNQEDFTKADLNSDSYVAVADFERNHVEDKIRTALQKVFNGAASPEIIPDTPKNPGPYDFVAYSYLFKNLQFPLVFAENKPLSFASGDLGKSTEVNSFGFMGYNEYKLKRDAFSQVTIFDYLSDENFIITLKTKDPKDQLILAKITPGASLRATIDAVLKRMKTGKSESAWWRDNLSIPKLNYRLESDYPELVGLTLKPAPNTPVKNLVTTEVKQLIRFQLNEKGAVLKSEGTISVALGAVLNGNVDTHEMIFDKPFLILMKRTDAAQPYFVMWVGNASLLTPAN